MSTESKSPVQFPGYRPMVEGEIIDFQDRFLGFGEKLIPSLDVGRRLDETDFGLYFRPATPSPESLGDAHG